MIKGRLFDISQTFQKRIVLTISFVLQIAQVRQAIITHTEKYPHRINSMPSSHDQSSPKSEQAEAKSLTLALLQVGQGWIVGTYKEDHSFEKLLPYGEVNSSTTRQAAIEAAQVWQEIRPEFSLSH